MAAPIHFIIGILILYNKTYRVCNKLSNIAYDRLVTAFTNFRALLHVNYSLQWSHRLKEVRACCFFLALRLTIVSLDEYNLDASIPYPQNSLIVYCFIHLRYHLELKWMLVDHSLNQLLLKLKVLR